MDVKSTYIPTWHPMDHVSWSLGVFSTKHLLEVGLIENQETMALRTLTTIDLFYFILWEDPAWIETPWNSIGWGPSHIWLRTTLEDMWPHYMILKVSWDSLWTLFFGLSQFYGHGSWLVCKVALSSMVDLTHRTLHKTLGNLPLHYLRYLVSLT